MGIRIIIPAYNEESRIAETLADYSKLIGRKKGVKIFVVSESTDGTNDIVRAYAKKHHEISLISGKRRRGKGNAVVVGARKALVGAKDSDLIGFTDADDAVASGQFMQLAAAISGYDCIIGSRYLKGSKLIGRITLQRKIASRAYNMLVRVLFGMRYHDTQCGAKLLRADALRSIIQRISVGDLSFDINLLYELERSGRRVREYPLKYFVKNTGKSVTLGQVIKMFHSTIRYRIDRGGR